MEAVLRDTKHDEHIDTKLKDQVVKVTRDVKDLGRLAGIRSRRTIDQVKDRGERMVTSMRTKGRETLEKRPLTSLIAAAGVGALAGLFLLRK